MTESSVWPKHLSQCFDLESLRTFGGFDENEDEAYEFFQELAEAFLDDSPPRIQAIQDAITTGAFDIIEIEAHSLKGSSRNIYAVKLGDVCEALERDAQSDDLAAASETIQSVIEEFSVVEKALNRLPELA